MLLSISLSSKRRAGKPSIRYSMWMFEDDYFLSHNDCQRLHVSIGSVKQSRWCKWLHCTEKKMQATDKWLLKCSIQVKSFQLDDYKGIKRTYVRGGRQLFLEFFFPSRISVTYPET